MSNRGRREIVLGDLATMRVNDRLKAILSEPLLHFALIGTTVFLLFGDQEGARPAPVVTDTVITVTPADVDRLSAQFAATWNRPPGAEELAGLVESHVREEVLYREAKALGLDEGDAVIRQRLGLKMEFIAEAAAAAVEPEEGELAQWYEAHADAFTPPPMIAFRQILLESPDAVETLRSSLAAGADPATLGRATMLPANVERASQTGVDGTFGPGFFDAVVELPVGEWVGPVNSAFGLHLVQLVGIDRPATPPLDAVLEQVTAAWRQAKADEIRAAQYEALRARYDIRLPETTE